MPDPLFKNPQRIFYVAALLAFLTSAFFGYQRRDGMLSGDEMAYRFQARIFASDRLIAPAPPAALANETVRAQFQFAHHLLTPRGWYGMYPVGWPLALALGTALHAGWLVNPLLGTLLLWLTWRLAKLCFANDDSAVLAALLLFPCPFFWINTSGDMSHALAACAVTAALCFVELGLIRRSALALSAAIALLGLCLCIRSFTALAATLAIGPILLFRIGRDRLLLRLIPCAVAASVLALGLTAAQNHYQTGSYSKSAYAFYAGKSMPEEISLDSHAILAVSPRETTTSLISTFFNSTPFLFLLAGCAILQPSIPRGKTALLAAVFTGSVLLYIVDLVPNASLPGQRMYFEGLPGIAVLAAAGFSALRARWIIARPQLVIAFVALATVQFTQYILTAGDIQSWIAPSTDLHHVLNQAACTNCVVFIRFEDMAPSDSVAPRNFNINSPDWPHAAHLYVMDPGPSLRDEVTRELGRPEWALVVYDGGFGASAVRKTQRLAPAPAAPSPASSSLLQ